MIINGDGGCSFWQPVQADSQPKSSNEPGELSQWLCIINIVVVIIIIIIIMSLYCTDIEIMTRCACVLFLVISRNYDVPVSCMLFVVVVHFAVHCTLY